MSPALCAWHGSITFAMLASVPAAQHDTHEIMVGWKTTASAPDAVALAWSETPALPAAAITDLVELRSAIESLDHPETALLVSNDGRRAAAARVKRGADTAQPSGVTVWAEWRNAERTITFDDVSQVAFVSNHHLLISHHPDGGPYVSWVVDVRHPETRFHFPHHRLNTLSVTDAGRWAALTRDGRLVTGRLEPAGAGDGTTMTGTAIPLEGTVRSMLWRHDGRFLLVEQDGPEIHSLKADDWSRVSTIAGGLGPVPGHAMSIGIDACAGDQPGVGACVFTTSSNGELTVTRWPHQTEGESFVNLSPLRKFVVTQRRDAIGFVERRCRRAPGTPDTDTVPTWPALPRGIRIQHAGWLLWNPPTDH